VGVEPTILAAKDRINGFEGHENHRTPCASVVVGLTGYKIYWTYSIRASCAAYPSGCRRGSPGDIGAK